jgi:tRNA A37 threonylcarbamoyladenosine modification protein TsaB
VLVLALDTATPAVTAGVVELTAGGPQQRSVRVAHDARKHAELLMPGVLAACADAGVALQDVAAIVTGTGPGPFTGLRVGMVTAAALGDALGVPVHGVATHDAIAHDADALGVPVHGAAPLDAIAHDAFTPAAGEPAGLIVVTDARRREVYWSAYAGGSRTDGPRVDAPAALLERLPGLGVGSAAGGMAEVTGLAVRGPAAPSPAGLVAVAAPALLAGTVPGPLEPLYLRRPDAVEPGARKRVSA